VFAVERHYARVVLWEFIRGQKVDILIVLSVEAPLTSLTKNT
jgi:hypothetical protein